MDSTRSKERTLPDNCQALQHLGGGHALRSAVDIELDVNIRRRNASGHSRASAYEAECAGAEAPVAFHDSTLRDP